MHTLMYTYYVTLYMYMHSIRTRLDNLIIYMAEIEISHGGVFVVRRFEKIIFHSLYLREMILYSFFFFVFV